MGDHFINAPPEIIEPNTLHFTELSLESVKAVFPMVLLAYTTIIYLHIVLPANKIGGYVCDRNGRQLGYRLNGLRVLYACIAICYWLHTSDSLLQPQWLAINVKPCAVASAILGVLVSFYFYLTGTLEPERRCLTVEQNGKVPENVVNAVNREEMNALSLFFFDLYSGLEFNPRISIVDVKMALYLIGGVTLQLLILSFYFLKAQQPSGSQLHTTTYVVIFSYWVHEYLAQEYIHLYTYDIFAEKVGFKLVFGCFSFFPFFYAIGAFNALDVATGVQTEPWFSALCVVVFLIGYGLARGANNQKHAFKTNGKEPFLGIIPQRTVGDSHILCSGFWGISRHINYLGEIIMAISLALPGGIHGAYLPWLYPLYYVLLMIPRERADNEMCARKYGKVWEEYCEQVPYRIIPFVY